MNPQRSIEENKGQGSVSIPDPIGDNTLNSEELRNSILHDSEIDLGKTTSLPRSMIRTPRSGGSPRGKMQDFVHVVIRLKPQLKRIPDVYMRYIIDSSNAQLGATRTVRPLGSPSIRTPRASPISNSGTRSRIPHSSRIMRPPGLMPSGGSLGTTLTIVGPASDGQREEQRSYEFGDVIDCNTTDEEMCNNIVPQVVDQLTFGYNACILCYGQTGSGKTHTINSIIPFLTQVLFQSLNPKDDVVEMSYIQIYNNNAYNLLAPSSEGHTKEDIGSILPKPKGVLISEPWCLVKDASDLLLKINSAQKRRCVYSHALNARSSRSHTLLSLRLTKCIDGTPMLSTKVTLADLAGSERIKKSGAAGEEMEEAIAINKSLSTLHSLIRAAVADADVLPFRESLLTLYLAPSLSDCYLLLIGNISLEKTNFSETKSTLEFATTAKRCVITKTKSKTTDRINLAGSYENTYTQLIAEIAAIEHKVRILQEQVAIEKERSALQKPEGAAADKQLLNLPADWREGDGSKNESSAKESFWRRMGEVDTRLRERILDLECQCQVFQSMIRDREDELISLESRRAFAEEVRKELEQRSLQREEAKKTLDSLPNIQTSEALDNVTESFLWVQEQLDHLQEQKRVMERAIESLRGENRALSEELLDTRKELVRREKDYRSLEERLEVLSGERNGFKKSLEESQLELCRERTRRAVREEALMLYSAPLERAEECGKLKSAVEEQRALCDSLQSRLTIMEQELERSEAERTRQMEDVKRREEAFVSLWALLTPQQKSTFNDYVSPRSCSSLTSPILLTSPGAFPSPALTTNSLNQGHENIQLRSQLREFRRRMEDEIIRSREKDYRIEDLEAQNQALHEQIRESEDKYFSLLTLEESLQDQKDQMERQFMEALEFIDLHMSKQNLLEQRLRDATKAQESLLHERDDAQIEIISLTGRLEKATAALKEKEEETKFLTHRLQETEAQRNTAKDEKSFYEARLEELEMRLDRKERANNGASHPLGQSERRRQYLASEAALQNVQGEAPKKMFVRMNQEEMKRNLGRIHTGDTNTHVGAFQKNPPEVHLAAKYSTTSQISPTSRQKTQFASNNYVSNLPRKRSACSIEVPDKLSRGRKGILSRPILFAE